ncbi:hypothetical protein SETIT_9G520600v2 [Setaria italica]|uniref:TFIIE beta domain-containing protein n=1 Tax=Setaria italica TaxID=4555 RepID=A0A368SX44_SETIT|nr:hypothetical protein SETIT_9G520600v2 [Setaria italica]
MALNERLNKFKQQPKVAPGFRPANAPFAPVKPLQPVKFSDDTERLQHINSIRKSTVGAQIKLVIILLEKTRQAFTAEQINEATYVDIRGNKAVFDSLKNNPKVKFEGEHFFYKALKESGDVWWLSGTNSQEDTAHFHDRRFRITIDNDLKQLYREIELPRDMLDIEKELKKSGEKPLTDTVNRRALAQIHGAASKSKARKKQRGITTKTRITNYHLPELFKNLDT